MARSPACLPAGPPALEGMFGRPLSESRASHQTDQRTCSPLDVLHLRLRTESNRQGVNSALEDVVVLERALASCEDRVEDALPEYERSRAADSKAVVRVRRSRAPASRPTQA